MFDLRLLTSQHYWLYGRIMSKKVSLITNLVAQQDPPDIGQRQQAAQRKGCTTEGPLVVAGPEVHPHKDTEKKIGQRQQMVSRQEQ